MDVKLPPGVVMQDAKPLTKKQRFGPEYLVDFNATQAAIRAGFSEKTAYSQGQRLLKDVEVQEMIAKVQKERSERLEIDAAWVLKRLADEATADIADIYGDDGDLLPVREWPMIWRQGLVQGIEVEELFEGRGRDRERIGMIRKVKLDNRVKRIELIGKHIGVQAFRDQVQQTGTLAINILPEDAEL